MKGFRNYLFTQICVLFISSFGVNVFAQNSNSLRILTLNFNAETSNKILRAKRIVVIEDYARAQNLDVIFIQECWSYQNFVSLGVKLAQDLNMDIAYHLEDGVFGIDMTSLVVLTKKELNLRNVKLVKLPRSAVTFGNGQTTWAGLGEVNMLVGGEITLPNGQPAFLWTSHLNNATSVNRLLQAQFAIKEMKSAAEEQGISWDQAWVIFGGDFNSAPNSPEQAYIRNSGFFDDTWTKAHPGDVGHTLAGDPLDPEYNPMIHGAGLFPPQYEYQDSEKIDYIYAHLPNAYGIQSTRVFTEPVNNVWMSDHFGLTGTFDFDTVNLAATPSADSDFANRTKIFKIDSASINSLPAKQDFTTNPQGGFTVINAIKADVQVRFTSNKKNVYTLSHAGIENNETVSFSFFSKGDYKYRMTISGYKYQILDEPKSIDMTGTIHVQ